MKNHFIALGLLTLVAMLSVLGCTNAADSSVIGDQLTPTMVPIPAGSFYNGTTTVTLSAFHMSAYNITQSQYQAVTGVNPSFFSGNSDAATCPVEQVTWYDAVEFCNRLSTAAGLTPVYTITGRTPSAGYPITNATVSAIWENSGYRLPSEAQWEYACRAGTTTTYFWSDTDAAAENYAWYFPNSGSKTHGVGQKWANPWGLFDIVGNVWQWCWAWYDNYPTNPTGPTLGTTLVIRGGGWGNSSTFLTSAYRLNYYDPGQRYRNIGFRVCSP
jgi:formylglycine-generating enzyme required for sulfatase activity